MAFYQYNVGVPVGSDLPSIDQGPMLINTQSIPALISQDHQGFSIAPNTNNFGGIHLQARMLAQLLTLFSPGDGALYVNDDAKLQGELAWPFYVNANSNGNHLLVGPSLNQPFNGYLMIGDLMIQWGSYKSATGQDVISFIPSFSVTPFNILLQVNSASTSQKTLRILAVNNAAFELVSAIQPGIPGSGIISNWLAIGLR